MSEITTVKPPVGVTPEQLEAMSAEWLQRVIFLAGCVTGDHLFMRGCMNLPEAQRGAMNGACIAASNRQAQSFDELYALIMQLPKAEGEEQ